MRVGPAIFRARASLAFVLVLGLVPWLQAQAPFRRGDVNADGKLQVSDAVYLIGYLFLGGASPGCMGSGDPDASGRINLTDPILLLSHMFLGGQEPEPPFRTCGTDPAPEALSCDSHPACEMEVLIGSYSTLRTIAGKGEVVQVDQSDWEPRFEGGPAVEAELSNPHFAMGDAAGNIYIVDKDAHSVRKVAPDGKITTVAGTGVAGDDGDGPGPGTAMRLRFPNGLWVRGDGTVYILDTDNSKVRRLDPVGMMTTLIDSRARRIRTGRGLWVKDDESLAFFSSRDELRKWTPSGGVTVLRGGFVSLGNLAVDPQGELVATDRGEDSGAGSRVYRISGDGTRTPIAGNGTAIGGGDGERALDTGLHGVRGVWFLPQGGYLLATHTGSQVWFVDRGGIIHLFLDGEAGNVRSGDGEHFRTPGKKVSNIRGIALDRVGNLLIVENDYGFVRMVERSLPSGS